MGSAELSSGQSNTSIGTHYIYIIGHNNHGHYSHAGGCSVNSYVRENNVRDIHIREYQSLENMNILSISVRVYGVFAQQF